MKLLHILPVAALILLAACNTKTGSNNPTENQADTTTTTGQQETTDTTTTVVTDTASVVKTAVPSDDPVPTADRAVVIDFSATWCGPCQQFKPIFHKVAEDFASKATFYTVDVDDCKNLADKYKVSSIPCVVVLKQGAEPVTHVGLMDEAEFKALVEKNI